MKVLINLFITICFFIALTLLNVFSASASEKLTVTGIVRITHPAYNASNYWYGVRYPWNRDNTRILIYEEPETYYGVTGRGLRWGFISELEAASVDNGGSKADYEAVARAVPDAVHMTNPHTALWSPFDGEENIIYATYQDGWLKKINVDTLSRTNVVQHGMSTGFCYGYDINNKLICSKLYDNWSSGGVSIDIVNKIVTNVSGISTPPYGNGDAYKMTSCSQVSNEYWTWPDIKHAHGTFNPSRNMTSSSNYGLGGSTSKGMFVKNGCGGNEYFVRDTVTFATHTSWLASDNWYIAGGAGDTLWVTQPNLDNMSVYQVVFTPDNVNKTGSFEYTELWSMPSAGRWESSPGARDNYNWGAIPIPTVRKDGLQILFFSTNGKYSFTDGKSSSESAGIGMFLTHISRSNASTCTSFTYSAWGTCQSNGTQTRTATSSSPSGCTGGTPVLTQNCTYNSGTPALTILKTATAPTIDGNISEYSSANSFSYSPSSGGNTVTVKSLWDSQALYLAFTVTDSQLTGAVATRDGSVWNDDSIEWFIDRLNNGGSSALNSANMLADDYHGMVNILNTQYDSQGSVSGAPSSLWNGVWQSAVVTGPSGYTVEVKIPWTSIGFSAAPTNDTIVGMSFAVNDKDGSLSSGLMWPNITGAYENASNWQDVLLSGTTVSVDNTPPAPPIALSIN